MPEEESLGQNERTGLSKNKHMKNEDGVHLMSPCNEEYSLCGDAFDVRSEDGVSEMEITKEMVITCRRCIEIIELCHEYTITHPFSPLGRRLG